MAERRDAPVRGRKQPKQARSAGLVAAVLEAAAQVLARDGAHRFTTARVAERAGVSIGSVYQYFPNKAAILFRLQHDEWRHTAGLLRDILADTGAPPLARLRRVVSAFIRSECTEAALRTALHDAAPFYRDAPEAQTARDGGRQVVATFLEQAAPQASDTRRALAGDLLMTTLSQVGRRFSETPRTTDEIEAYAEALGDMLCGYVRDL